MSIYLDDNPAICHVGVYSYGSYFDVFLKSMSNIFPAYVRSLWKVVANDTIGVFVGLFDGDVDGMSEGKTMCSSVEEVGDMVVGVGLVDIVLV